MKMQLPRCLIKIVGTLALCSSSVCFAIDSITFASGAPLYDYQARVIIPILTAAFKENSIEFNAIALPSLRALETSNSGQLDGELHRVYELHDITNNKYPNLVRINCELLVVELIAFSKKAIYIKNWQDLSKYRIAYYRGRNNVSNHLNKLAIVPRVNQVNTDTQAFIMLAMDRVDIVISENKVGDNIISSDRRFTNISQVGHLEKTHIYAYMHKKHSALLPKIEKSLTQMKLSGQLQKIANKAEKHLVNID